MDVYAQLMSKAATAATALEVAHSAQQAHDHDPQETPARAVVAELDGASSALLELSRMAGRLDADVQSAAMQLLGMGGEPETEDPDEVAARKRRADEIAEGMR